jgi:PAS domain S-box-containing protein
LYLHPSREKELDKNSKESALDKNALMAGIEVNSSEHADLFFVVDAMPNISWVSKASGHPLYVNARWLEYTGLSFDEAMANWSAPLHPDDNASIRHAWQKALSETAPFDTDIRLSNTSGEYRWHRAYALPRLDSSGEINYWIGSCTDIHENKLLQLQLADVGKQLEEKVKERTSELDEIQSIAHVGSWEWDIMTGIITWSDEMYRVYGFEPGSFAVSFERFVDRILPEDREQVEQILQCAFDARSSFTFEHRIVRPDGGRRILLARGKVICNAEGQPVKMKGTGQDITESKIVEHQLRVERDLLESILNNSIDGVNAFDKEMKFILWNKKLEEITGLSASEVIGHSLFELFPDRNTETYISLFAEVFSGKTIHRSSITFENVKGTYDSYLIPLKDSNGRITGILVITHDITEQIKAEEERNISESLLREAQKVAGLGYWEWDIAHGKAKWSDELYELLGLIPGSIEPTNDNFLKQVHPSDRDRVGQLREIAKDRKRVLDDSYRIIRPDGQIRILKGFGKTLEALDGKQVYAGLIQDITEMWETQRQISVNESRLTEAQELAHMGSWEFDFATNEIIWSDENYRIFGLEPQSVKITNEFYQDFLDEDAIEYTNNLVVEVINKKLPVNFEHKIKRRDGRRRTIMGIIRPVLNEQGELIKISGYSHDITERKETEEQLRIKNEELLRSNQELEQFAYVASHDLKEPLRMITNYTQLLQHKYDHTLDDAAREYIQFAVDGAHRMGKLINDLLEFSRIGRNIEKYIRIDTATILQEVLCNLEENIKNANATITAADLPIVRSAPTYLTQLFQNLIGNALKFKSSSDPVININASRQNGHWLFSISDNGIGIDKEHQHKIFIIFQRLHDRNQYPGTGIGLAICKKIVEMHGGNIWVTSEPGSGSVFHFTLPAYE